jgi:rhodanese-related sulfurtransferase
MRFDMTMTKFFLSLCMVLLTACTSANDVNKVSLEQARAEHEAGKVTLIDIRETSEHRTGVAPGAVLLPMSELPRRLSSIPQTPDKPVLLICNTQNRSKATLSELQKRGYQNIRYVEGGMSQWAAKGWPLSRPQP